MNVKRLSESKKEGAGKENTKMNGEKCFEGREKSKILGKNKTNNNKRFPEHMKVKNKLNKYKEELKIETWRFF